MLSVAEKPESAAVPGRYADATLEEYVASTPTQQKALMAASQIVDYLTERSEKVARSAVFIGAPGVGKSHLAAAVCRAVYPHFREPFLRDMADWTQRLYAYRQEYGGADGSPRPPKNPNNTPVWVNVPSLLVDLKAEMRLDTEDQERTTFARALRNYAGLVVLDDVGRERISEWTGELLYTIVNDRYERELPTIATSNLSAPELVAAGYWPAISRLAQDGALVEIVAPDHRLSSKER